MREEWNKLAVEGLPSWQ